MAQKVGKIHICDTAISRTFASIFALFYELPLQYWLLEAFKVVVFRMLRLCITNYN